MFKALVGSLSLLMVAGLAFGQTVYTETFEDGDVSEWGVYRAAEEAITVMAMNDGPAVLQEGEDFIGMIGDVDVTYSGAAINLTGTPSDANYTVEGWFWVYANHPQGSAYTGLAAYADSSTGYYVKLVADFDTDNRFRLYNNQLNTSTFQYTFHHSIDASGVDKTEGWHYMKIVVQTQTDGNVAYTCYYDDIDLGTYVDDAEGHNTAGQPGLYAFQMDGVDGLTGYFDNITVTYPTTSVDDFSAVQPRAFALEQNYPNPFNPSTVISFTLNEQAVVSLNVYDLQGRLVNSLLQDDLAAQRYEVRWNGRDDAGQPVPAGLYLATLASGDIQISRKMMLAK
jgi:hypothetical protein